MNLEDFYSVITHALNHYESGSETSLDLLKYIYFIYTDS